MYKRDRLVLPECKQKHDITQGAGWVGQNDVTWEEAKNTGVPPNKFAQKAD
jgi:hypothetical protein